MFTNQYLINYARGIGAQFILRGIRCESDYEFERVMRNVNGDFDPHITTVFLMPPRDIAEVSSSMVKGLIGPEGWEAIVKQYVPAPVFKRLKRGPWCEDCVKDGANCGLGWMGRGVERLRSLI